MCYHAACDQAWLPEEGYGGDFTGAKRIHKLVGPEFPLPAAKSRLAIDSLISIGPSGHAGEQPL